MFGILEGGEFVFGSKIRFCGLKGGVWVVWASKNWSIWGQKSHVLFKNVQKSAKKRAFGGVLVKKKRVCAPSIWKDLMNSE